MFFCSILLYCWAHPSIFVFSRRRAGRLIACKPKPTSVVAIKLIRKSWWLPTPNLTGITHKHLPLLGASGPNAIDWFTSSKICSPKLPCREFPNHLLYTETIQVCQLPPQLPLINIFIWVDTQDKTFAILLPLLYVSKKIIVEACVRTGVSSFSLLIR